MDIDIHRFNEVQLLFIQLQTRLFVSLLPLQRLDMTSSDFFLEQAEVPRQLLHLRSSLPLPLFPLFPSLLNLPSQLSITHRQRLLGLLKHLNHLGPMMKVIKIFTSEIY